MLVPSSKDGKGPGALVARRGTRASAVPPARLRVDDCGNAHRRACGPGNVRRRKNGWGTGEKPWAYASTPRSWAPRSHGHRKATRRPSRLPTRLVQPGLLGYLRGIVGDDAEDVAADAWLEIARDLRRFRGDGDGFQARGVGRRGSAESGTIMAPPPAGPRKLDLPRRSLQVLVEDADPSRSRLTDYSLAAMIALMRSPPLSFKALTAFSLEQLTWAMTNSMSLGSTPVSSTGPSSLGSGMSSKSSGMKPSKVRGSTDQSFHCSGTVKHPHTVTGSVR